MPINSRTWYAKIDVFEPTKIVIESNIFQEDNLNFTLQNIVFSCFCLIFLDVGTAKDKF